MKEYIQQSSSTPDAGINNLPESFIQDPVLVAVLCGLSIDGEQAWNLVSETMQEDPTFLSDVQFRFVSAVRFMWKLGATIQSPEAENHDNWVSVAQGIIDRTDQATAERIPFVYQYLVHSMLKHVFTLQNGRGYKLPTWYNDQYDMVADLQRRYFQLQPI